MPKKVYKPMLPVTKPSGRVVIPTRNPEKGNLTPTNREVARNNGRKQ